MTATPVASRGGFPGNFLAGIALVFAFQVGLVFWLSDRLVLVAQKPAASPTVRWGDSRPAELVALEDPTLFVLPHQQGFSGTAWMKIPTLPFRSQNWSDDEPWRWLALAPEQLGTHFAEFIKGQPAAPVQNLVTVEPAIIFPQIPMTSAISNPSLVRIEGDLAGRRLLSHAPLRSWPIEELLRKNVAFLTNSVVQILVDEQGNTFSAVLLGHGSGYDEADKQAASIARSARFESIQPTGPDRREVPKPKLMLGTVIFEWQTLPATNGPSLTTLP